MIRTALATLRFAVNAPFAAVNWLATGSTGFESSWERWWRRTGNNFAPAMRDTAIWCIRNGAPLPIHKSLEPLNGGLITTYCRIAAKERGEHVVP